MSDLFHDGVPIVFIAKVWPVIDRTPWHKYQILTKRPERWRRSPRRCR
jgi:protein gp37